MRIDIDRYYNKKIIFLFLALNPCIDFIFSLTNIVFGLKVDIGLNQLIRIALILYMAAFIRNKKYIITSLAVGVYMAIGLLVYKFTGITHSWFADIAFSAKIWCGVVLLFAYIDLYRQKKIDTNLISKALAISLIIVGGSIIFSAMGLGFETYGNNRYGSKGFFNSQNAVGITLLILISINWIFYLKSKINLIALAVGAVAVILVGTKTALIGFVGCTVVFLAYELIHNKKIIDFIKKNKGIVITAICAFLAIVVFLMYSFLSGYFKVVSSYDSIYSILVSNRDLQVEWMKEYIDSGNGNILNILFGFGYSSVRNYLQSRKGDFSTVEQDYFGLYYLAGIVLLLIYVCLTIWIICLILKSIRQHCFSRAMLGYSVAFVLGVLHAFFAGHVFGEALSLIYFWLICAMIRIQSSKEAKNCEKS